MEELTLLDYISMLRAHKIVVLVTTVAALIIASIALLLMPKTYEGSTTLLFPSQGSELNLRLAQLVGLNLPSSVGLSGREVYMTVLKSRTISENVCESLNLDNYGLDYKDLQEHLVIEAPKEGGLTLRFEVPTSWLKGRVPPSELQKRTARLAADIANRYISELRIYDRSNALFMEKKQRIFIEEQLKRTRAELARAEASLQKFQETHPMLAPPDRTFTYIDQSLNIAAKQAEAEVALSETRGEIARARSTWDRIAPEGISPEAIIESPVISDLRVKLANLEVRRAALLEDLTENHPDVVSVTQEIDKLRDRIQSEIDQIIKGKSGSISPAHQELLKQIVVLEVTEDGIEARRRALFDIMSKLENQLKGLPEKEVQYARLLRDLKATETVYTSLLSEYAKARIAEGKEEENFIVLDKAVPPTKPSKPNVKLVLLAAAFLGFVSGTLTVPFRRASKLPLHKIGREASG